MMGTRCHYIAKGKCRSETVTQSAASEASWGGPTRFRWKRESPPPTPWRRSPECQEKRRIPPPPVASGHIGRTPHPPRRRFGYRPERAVTVVKALEEIDSDHGQRKESPGAGRSYTSFLSVPSGERLQKLSLTHKPKMVLHPEFDGDRVKRLGDFVDRPEAKVSRTRRTHDSFWAAVFSSRHARRNYLRQPSHH